MSEDPNQSLSARQRELRERQQHASRVASHLRVEFSEGEASVLAFDDRMRVDQSRVLGGPEQIADGVAEVVLTTYLQADWRLLRSDRFAPRLTEALRGDARELGATLTKVFGEPAAGDRWSVSRDRFKEWEREQRAAGKGFPYGGTIMATTESLRRWDREYAAAHEGAAPTQAQAERRGIWRREERLIEREAVRQLVTRALPAPDAESVMTYITRVEGEWARSLRRTMGEQRAPSAEREATGPARADAREALRVGGPSAGNASLAAAPEPGPPRSREQGGRGGARRV